MGQKHKRPHCACKVLLVRGQSWFWKLQTVMFLLMGEVLNTKNTLHFFSRSRGRWWNRIEIEQLIMTQLSEPEKADFHVDGRREGWEKWNWNWKALSVWVWERERERVLSVECVSASHSRTLLSSVERTLTESSPNDLNAKQQPQALAKKTIIG